MRPHSNLSKQIEVELSEAPFFRFNASVRRCVHGIESAQSARGAAFALLTNGKVPTRRGKALVEKGTQPVRGSYLVNGRVWATRLRETATRT